MDKFVNVGDSRVKVVSLKSYERKQKEEKEEKELRILERKVATRKKWAIRAAILTGAAIAALAIAVRVDYYNWKVEKYKQAGYKEVTDYSTGSNWVGSGLTKDEISFGTYLSEKFGEPELERGK